MSLPTPPIFKDLNGYPLDKWLNQHGEALHDKRVFYILKAVSDRDVIKFGIAGVDSGRPISRLQDYVSHHGLVDPRNRCSGVMLYYLNGTQYVKGSLASMSIVYKKEMMLKRMLRQEDGKEAQRGDERTSMYSVSELIAAIERPGFQTPQERAQAEEEDTTLLDTDDRFRIYAHQPIHPSATKLTRYWLEWTRPYDKKNGKLIYKGVAPHTRNEIISWGLSGSDRVIRNYQRDYRAHPKMKIDPFHDK